MYAAVEVKSFGSYLEVAKTACTQLTTKPIWDEKFELELQCVHSIRVILYVQINDKSQVIASQELTIDPLNLNSTKSMSIRLNSSLTLNLNMKFLSPKKTITRRRTRNKNDIFGNNLSELVKRENTTIPMILRDCVDVIESKGIFEVGIYRVSAVVSEVQKMKELYSKSRLCFSLGCLYWFVTFFFNNIKSPPRPKTSAKRIEIQNASFGCKLIEIVFERITRAAFHSPIVSGFHERNWFAIRKHTRWPHMPNI